MFLHLFPVFSNAVVSTAAAATVSASAVAAVVVVSVIVVVVFSQHVGERKSGAEIWFGGVFDLDGKSASCPNSFGSLSPGGSAVAT